MDPALVIIIPTHERMCAAVLSVGILQLYFQADAMAGAQIFNKTRSTMADRTDTPAAKAEDDKVRAAHEAGEPKGRAVDRPEVDERVRQEEDANLAEKKVAEEAEAYDEANSPSHGRDVEVPEGDPRHMRQMPPSDVAEALTAEEKARLAELRAKAPGAHAKERTDDEEAEYHRLQEREGAVR